MDKKEMDQADGAVTTEAVAAAPRPQIRSKPKKQNSRWINALLAVAVLVAVGGVAFAGGRMSAPTTATTPGGNGQPFNRFPGASGNPGPFPSGGNFPGGGAFLAGSTAIQGTVTAVDADSMTLQLEDGSTVEVAIDTATTYHQQEAATSADASIGSDVIVMADRLGFGGPGGPAASPGGNGSITAKDVTVVTP